MEIIIHLSLSMCVCVNIYVCVHAPAPWEYSKMESLSLDCSSQHKGRHTAVAPKHQLFDD